jgi:hypothetical protein
VGSWLAAAGPSGGAVHTGVLPVTSQSDAASLGALAVGNSVTALRLAVVD